MVAVNQTHTAGKVIKIEGIYVKIFEGSVGLFHLQQIMTDATLAH